MCCTDAAYEIFVKSVLHREKNAAFVILTVSMFKHATCVLFTIFKMDKDAYCVLFTVSIVNKNNALRNLNTTVTSLNKR
jgi:hypothetical protein